MSIKIDDHENYLRNNIFYTNNKWPQYNLLIDDIKTLSKNTKKNKRILFIERRNLYGDVSLLAPFFNVNFLRSIEYSTKNILKRKIYVKNLKQEKKIIVKKFKDEKLKKNFYDLIIIPNVIHHTENVELLLKKSFNYLRKKGQIYIFEPILREIHQEPDDFLRFTPMGMKKKLENIGFKKIKYKTTGGAFSSTIYCLDQAIQYLPSNLRKDYSKKIFPKFFKKFMNFEKKYTKNKIRKHSKFPTAFSIIGIK